MVDIGFLELDLTGTEVPRLLDGIGDAALATVAGRLDRLFLLRSPWASGLRFVGAQATPAGWPQPFSLAGGGTTIEGALTACLGEAAERLSQVERPGDVTATAPWAAVSGRIPPAAAPAVALSVEALLGQPDRTGERIDWLEGQALSGPGGLLPADWCLRRVRYGPLRIPGAAASTGCAAGPSREAAAASALLELVERDAASLWWTGARPARAMPLDQPALAEAERILRTLRGADTARHTRLLDITTDLGIPAVAAVSFDRAGRNFAAGLAARPEPGAAAAAALVELCQTEVGLQLALLKQRQPGVGVLTAEDLRHLERATGITADDPRLQTTEAALPGEPEGVEAALAVAGVAAYLVDLTRADLNIPVVKAVVPQLQLLPGNLRTPPAGSRLPGGTRSARFGSAISLL